MATARVALWVLIMALFFGGSVHRLGACACGELFADSCAESEACALAPDFEVCLHHHPDSPCHHHLLDLHGMDTASASSSSAGRAVASGGVCRGYRPTYGGAGGGTLRHDLPAGRPPACYLCRVLRC